MSSTIAVVMPSPILIGVIPIAISVLTLSIKVLELLAPRLNEWRDRRALIDKLGAELYDREEIRRATTNYIEPDFQSIDPSGAEDIRKVVCAREPLFEAMDRILEKPSEYKYVFVLGDSGMGKTAFLLNYYAYHWRSHKRRRKFEIKLVPLNMPNADKEINTITQRRADTVLLLDALDEDRKAIENYKTRLDTLLELTSGFKTILITCRTQFFSKEEEIPTETGVVKYFSVRPGEPKGFAFHKLYLGPFTDNQIRSYLKRRFPLREWWLRSKAWSIVQKAPDLVARPMLLAHVEDLVHTHGALDTLSNIYESMIDAWLERERPFVSDKANLRRFCELLAIDLFQNRSIRKMERIPGDALEPLAIQHGITLSSWQLRGRSLLNRDAAGNYKFAHRSFMEYLFAQQFLKGAILQHTEPWTDLMKILVLDMFKAQAHPHQDLRNADFSSTSLHGIDLSGTTLANTTFKSTILSEARLDGCKLSCANFDHADLSGAILADADLSSATFRSAKLIRANLTGANLLNATFENADLTGAIMDYQTLDSADFSFAKLDQALLRNARFGNARVIECSFEATQLGGANLEGSDLSGVIFRKCYFIGARFQGADMTGTQLLDCLLTDSNLAGAHLSGTTLTATTLTNANVVGADLRYVLGLKQLHLDRANGNEHTLLPPDLRMPSHWMPKKASP